jgi:hypothetical protein
MIENNITIYYNSNSKQRKENAFMKFNLKYLIFVALAPLCAIAGSTGDCFNGKGNFVLQSLSDYSVQEKLTSTDTSLNNETSREPITSTSGLLTFKDARHLWHFSDDNGRDLARATFHALMEAKQSFDHFGQPLALLIAPRLFTSDKTEDQEVAKTYFKMVLSDRKHKDYNYLMSFFKNDKSIKNKLKSQGVHID